MSTGSKTRIVAAAMVCGLAGVYAPAAEAQVEYGFTAGYGHSDNVFRVSDDEIASDILTAGVELNWQEDRTRIDADVRADLDFNHYLNVDENFDVDNQVTGNASGHVTLGIVPEHFTWLIEDSFGQTQQDPLVPATPESLESINYLTTGPDFTLLIGVHEHVALLGSLLPFHLRNEPVRQLAHRRRNRFPAQHVRSQHAVAERGYR